MMYAFAKDKPFYYTLTLLSLFFWYPTHTSKSYAMLFFSFSALLRVTSVLCALGTLVHLILAFTNNTDIDISEDIGDLTGFIGCFTLCLTFLRHHTKWTRFFNDLLNFKHFGAPPKYQKIVKRDNFIALLCILYTIPGMLWYCFLAYIQIPECHKLNKDKGLSEPCGMVNPTWMPIKEREGKYFVFCYLFQVTGIFVYLPSGLAICILTWEAAEVIVSRIEHLKGLFKAAFDCEDRKACVKQLHYCIIYHQDIISISNQLNWLVKSTVSSMFLTAAIVVGSLGSQMLQETIPKAISFVMGYVVAMFFVCHAGQRLIDESLDLSNYVYNSRWYEMDAKIKKDVVFVLARCQKPLHLSAPASMGFAGYVLFCVMIKTSYSYLTVLNQMM